MHDQVPVFGFLNCQQVADLFGVKKPTIRLWIRQGKFPDGMKAPGGKRWSRAIIDRFLERGQASAKTLRAIEESL